MLDKIIDQYFMKKLAETLIDRAKETHFLGYKIFKSER